MRKFEKSHPWIKFRYNFEAIPPKVWLLLGEAMAKCEHLAGVPLGPDVAKKLHEIYLAKGVLATTAIEGNTLSEKEVLLQVTGKLKLPLSKQYLGTEIENIKQACEDIFHDAYNEKVGKNWILKPEHILNFNERILRNLPYVENDLKGKIRPHEVGVGQYKGAPSQDCAHLLSKLCDWLQEIQLKELNEWGIIPLAILRALFAHLYLAWIHPFADGNGRTARLVEYALLVHAGVPTPAAHLLSNHYNQTRSEYYNQLAYASASGGKLESFLLYATQGFVDQLNEQVDRVRAQHMNVTWRNFVYEFFRKQKQESTVNRRRKELALALAQCEHPISVSEARTLSSRLAELYTHKTNRTILRDLRELVQLELAIEEAESHFEANIKCIEAFLPRRVE